MLTNPPSFDKINKSPRGDEMIFENWTEETYNQLILLIDII